LIDKAWKTKADSVLIGRVSPYAITAG